MPALRYGISEKVLLLLEAKDSSVSCTRSAGPVLSLHDPICVQIWPAKGDRPSTLHSSTSTREDCLLNLLPGNKKSVNAKNANANRERRYGTHVSTDFCGRTEWPPCQFFCVPRVLMHPKYSHYCETFCLLVWAQAERQERERQKRMEEAREAQWSLQLLCPWFPNEIQCWWGNTLLKRL